MYQGFPGEDINKGDATPWEHNSKRTATHRLSNIHTSEHVTFAPHGSNREGVRDNIEYRRHLWSLPCSHAASSGSCVVWQDLTLLSVQTTYTRLQVRIKCHSLLLFWCTRKKVLVWISIFYFSCLFSLVFTRGAYIASQGLQNKWRNVRLWNYLSL